jgi:hypothetical protein
MENCIRSLYNAKNLRSLTWTRDGALTSAILEALHHNLDLSEISINGNHVGNYDPALLLGLTRLQTISVIMPTAEVVNMLLHWVKISGERLRSLTLICKVCLVLSLEKKQIVNGLRKL